MDTLEWSQHARDVLKERGIGEDWVIRAIRDPDRSQVSEAGERHYIKAIPEFGGRFLRVVLNQTASPNRVVTAFFDRRLGRKE